MEEKVQVDILGLSTSPSTSGAFALILKEINGSRRLPIVIGQFEAQSIALEIEGIKPPRPLTHDLMKSVIDSLGSTLTEILINDLQDGTFYARLYVDSQEIDSRPSDAIALAVRYGAPIFVAEKVLSEAGFVADNEDAEPQKPKGEAASEPPKFGKLENLQQQLADAIAKEDYERAARLRDEISKALSRE